MITSIGVVTNNAYGKPHRNLDESAPFNSIGEELRNVLGRWAEFVFIFRVVTACDIMRSVKSALWKSWF